MRHISTNLLTMETSNALNTLVLSRHPHPHHHSDCVVRALNQKDKSGMDVIQIS
jgi:hypothetical protein